VATYALVLVDNDEPIDCLFQGLQAQVPCLVWISCGVNAVRLWSSDQRAGGDVGQK